LVEKPGRTKAEQPRRWHGQSVLRQVEVQYSDGRVAQAAVRFVMVHAKQLAPQQAQTYAITQEKEAKTMVDQVYGVQPHHLLICDALGLDYSWYEAPPAQKNGRCSQTP
jgi:hypothetical protein